MTSSISSISMESSSFDDPDGFTEDLQVMNSYCRLMDMERVHLARYLAPEAQLEWFGRTIVGRDKIKTYLGLDVPETRHNILGSVIPASPIPIRRCRLPAPPPPPLREARVSELTETFDNLSMEEGAMTPPSGIGRAPESLMTSLTTQIPRHCKTDLGLEFSRRRDFHSGSRDEIRWTRRCLLKLGYVRTLIDGFPPDIQFTAIVYRYGSRCRRNLGHLFDQMDE